jgi:AcrR family transcriptional regulator
MDRTRDAEILDATLSVLNEVGFANLRMEDVADRARVGLSTIYRRWRTREELIIAAMRVAFEEEAAPQPGEARAQLHEMADKLRNENAGLLPGIVQAIQNDEQLGRTYRAGWLEPRLRALAESIQRTSPSPSADRAELLAEAALALMTFRLLLLGRPIDHGFIDRIVDELILPLLEE